MKMSDKSIIVLRKYPPMPQSNQHTMDAQLTKLSLSSQNMQKYFKVLTSLLKLSKIRNKVCILQRKWKKRVKAPGYCIVL